MPFRAGRLVAIHRAPPYEKTPMKIPPTCTALIKKSLVKKTTNRHRLMKKNQIG